MADYLLAQHCKLPNLSQTELQYYSSYLFVYFNLDSPIIHDESGDFFYFLMVVLSLRNIIDFPRARVHLTNTCFLI